MLCGRDWAIHDDSRHPFTPRGQGSEFDPSPMYTAPPVTPVPRGSVPEERRRLTCAARTLTTCSRTSTMIEHLFSGHGLVEPARITRLREDLLAAAMHALPPEDREEIRRRGMKSLAGGREPTQEFLQPTRRRRAKR
jgi:hypothetical protein